MPVEILILIAVAAAIQASFQLSVSMLTVMSGHALGRRTAHMRLLNLLSSFYLGVLTLTMLSVSFAAVVLTNLTPNTPPLLWSALSGLMVGVGVAVWLFYYRYRTSGTVLWVPRPMASYLSKRAKATTIGPEAFGLGAVSVVGEFIFSATPALVVAALLTDLSPPLQLAALLAYSLVATLPLLIIIALVGSGHSLARIQRWRERNKRFLQFTAGTAMVVLGMYLYVSQVIAPLAAGSV